MRKKRKIWHAVDILVDEAAVEAIESAFCQMDSLGTETNSLLKIKGKPQLVTGFFDSPPEETNIRSVVDETLGNYGFGVDFVKNIANRTIEETDWLAEWKKHWRPTTVGRFIIAPPWSRVADTEKIIIRIEPNMAFGTGTHETTQLCLKAIDENYTTDMSLLDVGTGTGILAIAATKIATEHAEIVACDTDVDSIEIARDNATANGVGDKIEFSVGSITGKTSTFDFVCANLTLDVITPLLPLLVEKSRHTLLLSGILAEQEDAVIADLLKLQISNFQIESAGEWISVLITDH